MALNPKQRLFVENFCGDNIVESMQVAGYIGDPQDLHRKGEKLLEEKEIREALVARNEYQNKTNKAIATRNQRMEFWTKIMVNEDPNPKNELDPTTGMTVPPKSIPLLTRIKASELLAKADGDFVEKLEITGKVSLEQIILDARKIPDNAIETTTVDRRQQIKQAQAKMLEQYKENIPDYEATYTELKPETADELV